MIDASPTIQYTYQPVEAEEKKGWMRLLQPFGLGIILLISIFMNFYQLGQNGYANTYYAAAVRSMLDSWHTFFFVSLDPVGFVTVDKPPLGFWLQVLSAKILALHHSASSFPRHSRVFSRSCCFTISYGATSGLLRACCRHLRWLSVQSVS